MGGREAAIDHQVAYEKPGLRAAQIREFSLECEAWGDVGQKGKEARVSKLKICRIRRKKWVKGLDIYLSNGYNVEESG
ncbi:MAG TPA: hypothetical protein VFF68_00755 [Anaerolineaceae bacterium]|nr:hypothetical protein [Anaerolineaceae bacterium]